MNARPRSSAVTVSSAPCSGDQRNGSCPGTSSCGSSVTTGPRRRRAPSVSSIRSGLVDVASAGSRTSRSSRARKRNVLPEPIAR